jgi:hypothetical protein
MNTSFSKRRHIQEANYRLEKRTIVEQQTQPTTGQTQPTTGQTDGGKAELVEVFRNKLNRMEKDNKFSALGVAQVMYNNSAHFINKTDLWSDQTKYGAPLSTKAPFAPQN